MLPTSETRSTCPYCGVGCGVIIESRDDQITAVRGDPDHPANFGRLCTKGSTLHFTAKADLQQQMRLQHPMRRTQRGAAPEAITWDTALTEVSDRLSDIWLQHGADAIGIYVSGQLLTEDYYVFNKLVKGLLGSNHIDTNSRLCMSSAVAGYKATLGADAPPCSYEDFADAQTVLIAGSNMAWAHPILFRRLEDAKRDNPQQKWIVIDPRRTETAEQADLHLQLLPGTDVALFHGMLHIMLWEGLVDHAYISKHTHGFEKLRDRVRECTPAATARITGCREEDIVTAARWFASGASTASAARADSGIQHTRQFKGPATLSLYCQGLNQSSSGTDKNAALINLHLATGQIGKPGAGPFSLTGQPNAMGGREVGGLANLLSAHRDLNNAQHRAEVAALWGLPDVPSQPGRTAVEMFQAAADGQVKALWIACTNPAQSLPDQATVRAALQRAEFVIVQEAYAHTATARYADILLPATTWGEKDGTVTNSERRISRVRPAVKAVGEARHDWVIARDVARLMSQRIGPETLSPAQRAALFDYPTVEAVWNEHRETTRGRDLDITGLSYDMLDLIGPQQWPMPMGVSTGLNRLYADGRFPTADGRARFADVAIKPLAEPRNAVYPFGLNTGRLRDQWHAMSRTGTLARLFGHAQQPVVELNPQDMDRLGIKEHDPVRLTSKRGTIVMPASSSTSVAPMQVFLPMHWGSEFMHNGGINELTTPTFCPVSKQPELKHAAVRVERVSLPWQLMARVLVPEHAVLTLREKLMEEARCISHADLSMFFAVPFGRDETGLLIRAAAPQPPHAAFLLMLRKLLSMQGADVAVYEDVRAGQQRCLKLSSADLSLSGYWLSGDISGHELFDTLLTDRSALPASPAQLLAPGALRNRSIHVKPASPQVCSCFDVAEAQICDALTQIHGTEAERLSQLQAKLRCGTQCGSCLPKLRTWVRVQAPDANSPTRCATN